MKPVNKYIFVRPSSEREETKSGLLLSAEQQNQMRYGKGIVEEFGELVKVINKGDEVYFDKRRAFTLLIKGERYTVITEQDLIVVI